MTSRPQRHGHRRLLSARAHAGAVVVAVAVAVGIFGAAGAAGAGPKIPTATATGTGTGTGTTEISAALDAVRAALARRAFVDVVAGLERALRVARAEAPLVVAQARLVRDVHAGLGTWKAAPSLEQDGTAVVDGRTLRLYVEVDNVVDAPLPDGRRRLALGVRGRFSFWNDDGTREDLGEKDLGRQELALWRTTGVHSFGVDVALSDKAPPGRYQLTVVVSDEVGHKTGERAVPFVLR